MLREFFLSTLMSASAHTVTLIPDAETMGIGHAGDSDDPAIWVHPEDSQKSLIIGTYKRGGLAVFNLGGERVQWLPDGHFNNVDLRTIETPTGAVDLVVATERKKDRVYFYRINREEGILDSAGFATLDIEPYGLCLYHSQVDSSTYVFVTAKDGGIEQLKITRPEGTPRLSLVRSLHLNSQTEGCVADDQYGRVYFGEEQHGVWRFESEPVASAPIIVDSVITIGGHLTADVEGMAIYQGTDGRGHLVVSSQGSHEYAVFERSDKNAFVGMFRLKSGNGIDAVTATDGLDVVSADLGPNYPEGIAVVHDDDNAPDAPNFKILSWRKVRESLNLCEVTEAGGYCGSEKARQAN